MEGIPVRSIDLREKQSLEVEQLLKEHQRMVNAYALQLELLETSEASIREVEQVIESLGGHVDRYWGDK